MPGGWKWMHLRTVTALATPSVDVGLQAYALETNAGIAFQANIMGGNCLRTPPEAIRSMPSLRFSHLLCLIGRPYTTQIDDPG